VDDYVSCAGVSDDNVEIVRRAYAALAGQGDLEADERGSGPAVVLRRLRPAA
jgi:hypothetical protein